MYRVLRERAEPGVNEILSAELAEEAVALYAAGEPLRVIGPALDPNCGPASGAESSTAIRSTQQQAQGRRLSAVK